MKKMMITLFLVCHTFASSIVFCSDAVVSREMSEQVVKKGDLLSITVMGHDDLQEDVVVNNEGKITCSLINEVGALDMTLIELARAIEAKLAEFIRSPRVTVRYHNTFFVYGEVGAPGEYKLQGHINVLKAIVIAGGFTDFASHRVKVIKASPERKDVWVNVDGIIKGKGKDKDILVMPGDVIVVPESFF